VNILACGHYFLHVLSYHVELALINAGNNSSTYSALDNSMLLFNPHVARVIALLLFLLLLLLYFIFLGSMKLNKYHSELYSMFISFYTSQ